MNMRWSKAILIGLVWMGWSARGAQADVRVLCAGDSITKGYGVNVPYPTRLANNTGRVTINVGRGGMWASYGLKNIDKWLLDYDPSHVLILYGTNDTNDPNQSTREAAKAVMDTARKVRAYGAIPVVGTIPPKIGSRAYQMPRVTSFNNYLRSYTANEGILLADIEAAFGSGSGLFQSDGFHPNDSGMEVIARTFADKIQFLALTPTSVQLQDIGANGQTIAVECNLPWTTAADQPWIAITSGLTGTGDGTIAFNVAVNTGVARTGTITVADGLLASTVVVTQAAAQLEARPLSFALPCAGATHLQIAVTARLPWTATANQPWIAFTSGTTGVGNGIMTINVASNGGAARRGTITFSVGETTCTVAINQWPASTWGQASPADFDGNGFAELAVFHPATGNWHLSFSGGPQWLYSFGWSAVVPVPADYDGDGLLDFGVYHPASGNWHILESTTGHFQSIQLGYSATVPLPGDYDGDGVADLAVFLPANGRWYFLCSTAGRYSVQWGWSTTVPVPADYDGDGATDIGVYHPASGQWSILPSSFPAIGPIQTNWGSASEVPVPADYDGDGKADIAVFLRATGTWRISYSGGGSWTKPFGWATTTPVAADYDKDGKADLAVYHPTSGNWHIRKSSTGGILVKNWGWSTAKPTLLYPMIHSWFGLP
jgi:lysophospholipase L1-like esterase